MRSIRLGQSASFELVLLLLAIASFPLIFTVGGVLCFHLPTQTIETHRRVHSRTSFAYSVQLGSSSSGSGKAALGPINEALGADIALLRHGACETSGYEKYIWVRTTLEARYAAAVGGATIIEPPPAVASKVLALTSYAAFRMAALRTAAPRHAVGAAAASSLPTQPTRRGARRRSSAWTTLLDATHRRLLVCPPRASHCGNITVLDLAGVRWKEYRLRVRIAPVTELQLAAPHEPPPHVDGARVPGLEFVRGADVTVASVATSFSMLELGLKLSGLVVALALLLFYCSELGANASAVARGEAVLAQRRSSLGVDAPLPQRSRWKNCGSCGAKDCGGPLCCCGDGGFRSLSPEDRLIVGLLLVLLLFNDPFSSAFKWLGWWQLQLCSEIAAMTFALFVLFFPPLFIEALHRSALDDAAQQRFDGALRYLSRKRRRRAGRLLRGQHAPASCDECRAECCDVLGRSCVCIPVAMLWCAAAAAVSCVRIGQSVDPSFDQFEDFDPPHLFRTLTVVGCIAVCVLLTAYIARAGFAIGRFRATQAAPTPAEDFLIKRRKTIAVARNRIATALQRRVRFFVVSACALPSPPLTPRSSLTLPLPPPCLLSPHQIVAGAYIGWIIFAQLVGMVESFTSGRPLMARHKDAALLIGVHGATNVFALVITIAFAPVPMVEQKVPPPADIISFDSEDDSGTEAGI